MCQKLHLVTFDSVLRISSSSVHWGFEQLMEMHTWLSWLSVKASSLIPQWFPRRSVGLRLRGLRKESGSIKRSVQFQQCLDCSRTAWWPHAAHHFLLLPYNRSSPPLLQFLPSPKYNPSPSTLHCPPSIHSTFLIIILRLGFCFGCFSALRSCSYL